MYELVCGMEVHLQMNTHSKLFCPDAVAFGSDPNTQVSYISAGHPGTLPYLNQEAIKKAVMLGLVTNCEINPLSYFDRKNYFYPDLPKGFQTTQDSEPICKNGFLMIETEAGEKKIRINRIHIEEDAGKSTHDLDPSSSLIDLNRAGTPLMELVTEPDFRSPEEAATFAQQLRQLARYIDVCDGNMQEGSLRFDANISVRKKGAEAYGTRAEIKNLNSFRFLKKAMQFEFDRQVALVEKGEEVVQETRGFDPETGRTIPQREKEDAHDLPAIKVSPEFIEQCKAALPEMPAVRKKNYIHSYSLNEYAAEQLSSDREYADYFEEVAKHTHHHSISANWLINEMRALLNDSGKSLTEIGLSPYNFAEIVEMVASGKVNVQGLKDQLLPELLKNYKLSPRVLAESLNLFLQTDEGTVLDVVNSVLSDHPKEVDRYQKGARQLMGMFIGEVMKRGQGKIDPKQANKILQEKLNYDLKN